MDTPQMQDSLRNGPERVRIYVTREVSYNLDKMMKVTKQVLGKLGCEGCHSGRILDFIEMQDFVVNPKTLEVQEMTGSVRFGG